MRTLYQLFLLFLLSLPLSAQHIFLQQLSRTYHANTQILAAKYAPAGDVLALSGNDKLVRLLDGSTLVEKQSFSAGAAKAFGLAISGDGRSVFAGNLTGQISVWDVPGSASVRSFSHEAGIRCIDIDRSGRVISGGTDRIIKLWDGATGTLLGAYPPAEAEITGLAFSPDGTNIAAGCADGSVELFDARTLTLMKVIAFKRAVVVSLAYSPDGKYFATSHGDSTISVWNPKTGVLITTVASTDGVVSSLAFHPNSTYLITASSSLSFWDIAGAKKIMTLADTGFVPRFVSVMPQTQALALTDKHGAVRLFRMMDKPVDTLPPVITILQPKQNTGVPTRLFASEIDVAGLAADASPISSITLNGRPMLTAPAAASERVGIDTAYTVVKFTATAPLDSIGSQTFVLSATDSEHHTARVPITIVKLTKDASVELVDTQETIDTDQLSVDLQFRVWFDFASYSIVLNTIEIAKKENIPVKPPGTVRTEKISLSVGFNQVQLTVNGRRGEKMRKTLSITRRMTGAAAAAREETPGKSGTPPPQRWAVVVGISDYANASIKDLTYADTDAREFADFIRSPAGGAIEKDHMKILLNKDATLQNVKQALFNFLRQTVDKDLVMIYFAGHGVSEPGNAANNYLLCHDSDPKSLESTAFPMWDVKTALTRYIPSKRVVVFTDACHSGGITTDLATRGMNATDDNASNQYISDLSKSKEGVIVFTASQAGEVSQELTKLHHGVFTYYLLEGMKGKADYNNDYTVTIGELMDFVEEKVKRETNGNQHPIRNQGTYDTDLTISIIPH